MKQLVAKFSRQDCNIKQPLQNKMAEENVLHFLVENMVFYEFRRVAFYYFEHALLIPQLLYIVFVSLDLIMYHVKMLYLCVNCFFNNIRASVEKNIDFSI